MKDTERLPGGGEAITEWPAFLVASSSGWRTFYLGGNSCPSGSAEVFLWKQLTPEQQAKIEAGIKSREQPES